MVGYRVPFTILLLFVLTFTVSVSSVNADWIVRSDSGLTVTRTASPSAGTSITFSTRTVQGKVSYQVEPEHGEAELVIDITRPIRAKVTVPEHFPLGTKYIYNTVVTNGDSEKIDLGTPRRIARDVKLTRYGYVTIQGGPVVFASGLVLVPNQAGTAMTAVFLNGKDFSYPVDTLPIEFQKSFSGITDFLTKESEVGHTFKITDTNLDPDTIALDGGRGSANFSKLEGPIDELNSYQQLSQSCQAVPKCCCKPGDLAPDGNCYRVDIVIPGAGSSGSDGTDSGSTAAAVKNRLESSPCTSKNTHILPLPKGSLLRQSVIMANQIKKILEGCPQNRRAHMHAHCYGGNIAFLMMDQLPGYWDIGIWSTPLYGASTISAIELGGGTILSGGVPFLILSSAQIRTAFGEDVGLIDADSRIVPDRVNLEVHVGTADHFVEADEQAPNLQRVPENRDRVTVVTHPGGGHFDTMRDNFKAPVCCGDGQKNGEEQCDGTDGGCDGPTVDGGGGWACNEVCKCAPKPSCECIKIDYADPANDGKVHCMPSDSAPTGDPDCPGVYTSLKRSPDGKKCWCEKPPPAWSRCKCPQVYDETVNPTMKQCTFSPPNPEPQCEMGWRLEVQPGGDDCICVRAPGEPAQTGGGVITPGTVTPGTSVPGTGVITDQTGQTGEDWSTRTHTPGTDATVGGVIVQQPSVAGEALHSGGTHTKPSSSASTGDF